MRLACAWIGVGLLVVLCRSSEACSVSAMKGVLTDLNQAEEFGAVKPVVEMLGRTRIAVNGQEQPLDEQWLQKLYKFARPIRKATSGPSQVTDTQLEVTWKEKWIPNARFVSGVSLTKKVLAEFDHACNITTLVVTVDPIELATLKHGIHAPVAEMINKDWDVSDWEKDFARKMGIDVSADIDHNEL